MPVRSLTSAVLKWPDRDLVLNQARRWAKQAGESDPNIIKILCYGSIVTGEWGVGSDLDVIIVINESTTPFNRRSADFSIDGISVPVDLTVYTVHEYASLCEEGRRIAEDVRRRSVTLYRKA